MRKNFDVELKSLKGETLRGVVPEVSREAVALTRKNVACSVLLSLDEKAPGAEKWRRAVLADRIYNGEGEQEVSLEDAALIKKLVGEQCGPIIVMQMWKFLENDGGEEPHPHRGEPCRS